MKLHRAVTLALLLLLGVAALGLMLSRVTQPGHSLGVLLLVLALAAVAGVAMSWQRYGIRPRWR